MLAWGKDKQIAQSEEQHKFSEKFSQSHYALYIIVMHKRIYTQC